jgi:ribosomal 50S subunit-recycling heat shock protein
VKPGDVLTVAVGEHILVLKVRATALRRGQAADAVLLYEKVDAGEGEGR